MEKERKPVPVKLDLAGAKEFGPQRIAVDNKGGLYFVGTYTLKDMGSIVGLYSAKIDIEKQVIVNSQTSDFTEEFLTRGLKESEAKTVKNKIQKGDRFEDHFYYLTDIEILANGSFVIGAERNYKTYYRNADGGTTTVHHYGDVVVAGFNADASFKWVDKIPRDLTITLFPLGHIGFVTDERSNIHVFYDNIKTAGSMFGVPPNKAKLMMYSFDSEGKGSWKEIHDNKSDKVIPRPWEFIYNDKTDEVIMMGHKGANANTISFTKVKLK